MWQMYRIVDLYKYMSVQVIFEHYYNKYKISPHSPLTRGYQ
jgi:hypothetical protein